MWDWTQAMAVKARHPNHLATRELQKQIGMTMKTWNEYEIVGLHEITPRGMGELDKAKQLLGKRKVQNNKIKNKSSVSGERRFLAERVVFLGALSWSSFSRGIWEGSWGGRLLWYFLGIYSIQLSLLLV